MSNETINATVRFIEVGGQFIWKVYDEGGSVIAKAAKMFANKEEAQADFEAFRSQAEQLVDPDLTRTAYLAQCRRQPLRLPPRPHLSSLWKTSQPRLWITQWKLWKPLRLLWPSQALKLPRKLPTLPLLRVRLLALLRELPQRKLSN